MGSYILPMDKFKVGNTVNIIIQAKNTDFEIGAIMDKRKANKHLCGKTIW